MNWLVSYHVIEATAGNFLHSYEYDPIKTGLNQTILGIILVKRDDKLCLEAGHVFKSCHIPQL